MRPASCRILKEDTEERKYLILRSSGNNCTRSADPCWSTRESSGLWEAVLFELRKLVSHSHASDGICSPRRLSAVFPQPLWRGPVTLSLSGLSCPSRVLVAQCLTWVLMVSRPPLALTAGFFPPPLNRSFALCLSHK